MQARLNQPASHSCRHLEIFTVPLCTVMHVMTSSFF